jgi:long-chain acyl-CoA synthetase
MQRAAQSASVDAYADRVASTGHWQATSWTEFATRLRRSGACLQDMGVRAGDYVAILAETGPEWHLMEHAAMLIGAVVVGIDSRMSVNHIARILSTTRPRLLVLDNSVPELSHEDLVSASQIVYLGDRPAMIDTDLTSTSWADFQRRAIECDGGQLPAVRPDDTAALIYTSGTTGTPKAIEYTHAQLILACQAIFDAFPVVQKGDCTLCWLPMAHLFQRMMNLVAIAQGTTIYFVRDPKSIADCAREVGPSQLVGVPRFYEKLRGAIEGGIYRLSHRKQRLVRLAFDTARNIRLNVNEGRRPGVALKFAHAILNRFVLGRIRCSFGTRLRFMITGSAPIAKSHLEFFADLGLPLYEAYGISECTVPIAANRPEAFRFGSVGIPFPQNDIRLEADGEILVRGPGVFKGYSGESRDLDRFTPDGFYRSGDLGRFDTDGYLYLFGRKSDMLKTSTGKKIFPTAIEQVYEAHPLIDQVVISGENRPYLVGLISVNNEQLQLELASSQVVAAQIGVSIEERIHELVDAALSAHAQYLAPHERIVRFTILTLPFAITTGEMTTNFKLRRKLIADKYAQRILDMYEKSAPWPTPSVREEMNACLTFS